MFDNNLRPYDFRARNSLGGEDTTARTQITEISNMKLSDYTYNLNGLKKIRSKKPWSAIIIGDSISAGTGATNNLGFIPQLNNATRTLQNSVAYENYNFYYNSNVGTWTKEEAGICKFLLSSKTGSTNLTPFANPWNVPQVSYTVQVVYSKRSDGGTFQIGYGSTPTILDTISCSGSSQDGIVSDTYTVPSGQNIYIIPTSGQKAYINSLIIVRDTSKPYYAIDNWSVGGRKAKDYTAAELTKMITYLPKDMLVWGLLTNDYSGGDFDSYANRTEVALSAAQSQGMDILIVIPCGQTGTDSNPQWVSKWKTFLYEKAKQYNAAIIDYDIYFGGITRAKANGLIGDSVHPTDAGHLLMANVLINILFNSENPYSQNMHPCTSDTRYPTFGAIQDNRNKYMPNPTYFDFPYFKSLDNNGNPKYVLAQGIVNDGIAVSNFPKYAPRGTIASYGVDIYVNTTDWGASRNTLATWQKIYARPKAELVTTLPTPTAGLRGVSILLDGNTSADDILYTCIKKSDGSYVWKQTTFA
ncbi:SGNH/GDSL hydrolase family protein [Paenibacillus xylaniclasticus]|uniref:SGNH/GDSL hydrolase family protein n=1 Tax=Paenibacillus xylaniclasticus TaxID=588083 RepID=UPI000FD7E2B2|nr:MULTISPECIES: SGNH/GDSL hydrolase family protein [Paenibacillus]GFN32602.1 hypothetical protein PCURB6_28620 [Paenibacillus curdlanolyticus]